jgi:hypothetical protein
MTHSSYCKKIKHQKINHIYLNLETQNNSFLQGLLKAIYLPKRVFTDHNIILGYWLHYVFNISFTRDDLPDTCIKSETSSVGHILQ